MLLSCKVCKDRGSDKVAELWNLVAIITAACSERIGRLLICYLVIFVNFVHHTYVNFCALH